MCPWQKFWHFSSKILDEKYQIFCQGHMEELEQCKESKFVIHQIGFLWWLESINKSVHSIGGVRSKKKGDWRPA